MASSTSASLALLEAPPPERRPPQRARGTVSTRRKACRLRGTRSSGHVDTEVETFHQGRYRKPSAGAALEDAVGRPTSLPLTSPDGGEVHLAGRSTALGWGGSNPGPSESLGQLRSVYLARMNVGARLWGSGPLLG